MKKIYFIIMIIGISTSLTAWNLKGIGTFSFKNISDNLYVMHGPEGPPSKANHGFMNNPAIIISKNGIILIDPGSTYGVGKQVVQEIKRVSQLPIIAVFGTHIHGDHWLGNQAIKEAFPDVKIYGFPAMMKQAKGEEGFHWLSLMTRLTEGLAKDTKIVPPTYEARSGQVITIDNQNFKIHASVGGKAHTDTDIMIEHIESKTLFLGDNGFAGRFGHFDESSDMHGNIETLQLAMNLKLKNYVPGHGLTGDAQKAVKPYLSYLQLMQKEVSEGFSNDKSASEIKKGTAQKFESYQHWAGFEENFGRHIIKMYSEVEERDF